MRLIKEMEAARPAADTVEIGTYFYALDTWNLYIALGDIGWLLLGKPI